MVDLHRADTGNVVVAERALAALRGVGGIGSEAPTASKRKSPDPDDEEAYPAYANDADPWKAHFAEIDAVLDRTTRVLAGETPLPKSRSHLVYDPDQDEAEAEDLWLDLVKRTPIGRRLPQRPWHGTPGWISTSTPACRGWG